ncbi:hypothetical protein BJV74DRAFT_78299 [Russula compacta]|nr:hypothetical protein BJV74DRAFT_78299 [Russula compacta]
MREIVHIRCKTWLAVQLSFKLTELEGKLDDKSCVFNDTCGDGATVVPLVRIFSRTRTREPFSGSVHSRCLRQSSPTTTMDSANKLKDNVKELIPNDLRGVDAPELTVWRCMDSGAFACVDYATFGRRLQSIDFNDPNTINVLGVMQKVADLQLSLDQEVLLVQNHGSSCGEGKSKRLCKTRILSNYMNILSSK